MKRSLALVSILFYSCVGFRNSHYNHLSNDERSHFKDVPSSAFSLEVDYTKAPTIYEMDYTDIMEMSRNTHKRIWIHFFAPWCSSASIGELEEIDSIREHYSDSLEVLLISTSYDYDYLADMLQHSALRIPVFVLDAENYGTQVIKSQKKFYRELSKGDSHAHFSDYIVQQEKLLFSRPWKMPLSTFAERIMTLPDK